MFWPPEHVSDCWTWTCSSAHLSYLLIFIPPPPSVMLHVNMASRPHTVHQCTETRWCSSWHCADSAPTPPSAVDRQPSTGSFLLPSSHQTHRHRKSNEATWGIFFLELFSIIFFWIECSYHSFHWSAVVWYCAWRSFKTFKIETCTLNLSATKTSQQNMWRRRKLALSPTS